MMKIDTNSAKSLLECTLCTINLIKDNYLVLNDHVVIRQWQIDYSTLYLVWKNKVRRTYSAIIEGDSNIQ